MAARPILFSGEMVRVILTGAKTQTRRPAKFITIDGANLGFSGLSPGQYCTGDLGSGAVLYSRGDGGVWQQRTHPLRYPALPGDLLWVRETWSVPPGCYDLPREIPTNTPVRYAADGTVRGVSKRFVDADGLIALGRPRPSIHMPRWAARIWLRVTDVRVERVQSISEEDARAEGFKRDTEPCDHVRRSCEEIGCLGPTFRASFAQQWMDIYGPESWERNDWVWALSFERIEKPEVSNG